MRNKKWISAAAAVVLAVTALPFTVTAGKNEEKELTKVTLNEVAHSIFYAPHFQPWPEAIAMPAGRALLRIAPADRPLPWAAGPLHHSPKA